MKIFIFFYIKKQKCKNIFIMHLIINIIVIEVIEMKKIYLCIDLKCFFASVECVERHLDPFQTNLVVADPSRGNGALCLATSPKMKVQGVRNRCRLFEIPKNIEYEVAIPRMRIYQEYAANIYSIYLKYVSQDDIFVYSIDELFIDATTYLTYYHINAEDFALLLLKDVYQSTGITATVGIGTNMYLAKVGMDIIAKHNFNNMAFLDEKIYKEKLCHYQPLTDFWHVGKGIVNRLSKYGIHDMYDIAHTDEEILYKEFGINAEYIIDHAWGKEPTTIAEIQQYIPQSNSFSNSQVLFEDYNYNDALLVVKEMVDLNVLRLVDQHKVTNHISISIGYSKNTIKSTGGSCKITTRTNSHQILLEEFMRLFKKTTSKDHPIRTISISFGNIMDEYFESYDLFTDYEGLQKERNLQQAIISIKKRFGKNSILKGLNYLDKATTIKRNTLIGGHNAQ